MALVIALTQFVCLLPFVQSMPVLSEIPAHDYGQDVIMTSRAAYLYGVDFHYQEPRLTVVPDSAEMIDDITTAQRVTVIDGHYEGAGMFIRHGADTQGLLPNPILEGRVLVFIVNNERIIFNRID